jgi:hypothetical protein
MKLKVALKTSVIDLIRDLRAVFTEGDDTRNLFLVELFFTEMSDDDLMEHAIAHILPHSKQIRAKDRHFFIDNPGIFAGLENKIKPDTIAAYRNKLSNVTYIGEENHEVIWNYFILFVDLTEKYRKDD